MPPSRERVFVDFFLVDDFFLEAGWAAFDVDFLTVLLELAAAFFTVDFRVFVFFFEDAALEADEPAATVFRFVVFDFFAVVEAGRRAVVVFFFVGFFVFFFFDDTRAVDDFFDVFLRVDFDRAEFDLGFTEAADGLREVFFLLPVDFRVDFLATVAALTEEMRAKHCHTTTYSRHGRKSGYRMIQSPLRQRPRTLRQPTHIIGRWPRSA